MTASQVAPRLPQIAELWVRWTFERYLENEQSTNALGERIGHDTSATPVAMALEVFASNADKLPIRMDVAA